MPSAYGPAMKKSTKAKAKRIAKQATSAIKKELDYALRDHKLSKKELKHVGGMIKAEAKKEGQRIGAFLTHEFRSELDKALPILKSYLAEGKKAVIKKRKR